MQSICRRFSESSTALHDVVAPQALVAQAHVGADLGRDDDVVVPAAPRDPAADDRLGFAALVARHPARVRVRGVDQVEAGVDEARRAARTTSARRRSSRTRCRRTPAARRRIRCCPACAFPWLLAPVRGAPRRHSPPSLSDARTGGGDGEAPQPGRHVGPPGTAARPSAGAGRLRARTHAHALGDRVRRDRRSPCRRARRRARPSRGRRCATRSARVAGARGRRAPRRPPSRLRGGTAR